MTKFDLGSLDTKDIKLLIIYLITIKYLRYRERIKHMENMNNEIHKKRWMILLTTVLLTFMATLDGSIVNVALPVMA